MIFRQLFEKESSTYTYLLGSSRSDERRGPAIIIDPVRSQVPAYLLLLDELNLQLIYALDTHLHADHVTGLGLLREKSGCRTMMGMHTHADCVSHRFRDGDRIAAGSITLKAMYTPGHTDDSYSFVMDDRVFTGDALLIRGTGRTDFQNGNPGQLYDSLVGTLLRLPDETLVYPAHDYKGWTVSTIGEEKAHNPRLQVKSRDEFIDVMNHLHLANPKQMDVAIPANLACGMNVS